MVKLKDIGEWAHRQRARSSLRNMLELQPISWENPSVVWEHPEGAYSVVRCNTQWDFNLETYFLAHCLGTKDCREFLKSHEVLSIRDRHGIPHATILCQRKGMYSPYGAGCDLGSREWFKPKYRGEKKREKPLRVLQVRGRGDDVAMVPFLEIAQTWFLEMGGSLGDLVSFGKWNDSIYPYTDSDYTYHFLYLLDEHRNDFPWTYSNVQKRLQGQREGTSL